MHEAEACIRWASIAIVAVLSLVNGLGIAGVRQKGRDVLSVVEAMDGHKVPSPCTRPSPRISRHAPFVCSG